jgi:hypothetical protein
LFSNRGSSAHDNALYRRQTSTRWYNPVLTRLGADSEATRFSQ